MTLRATVELSAERGSVLVRPVDGFEAGIARDLRTATHGRARRRHGYFVVPLADAEGLSPVPGLRWDDDARQAAENRRRVAQVHATVLARIRTIHAAGPSAARESLRGHGWVAALDDHQVLNVAMMTVEDGWGACVFDEQGTGKTPTMIATFDVLHDRDEADVLLVVAPKSMVGEWPAELEHFAEGLYRVAVVTGSRRERAQAFAGKHDVLVMNYEAVVAHLDNLKTIARNARCVLAVDESFFVKNPHSARAAAVAELREWCTHAYVLCGTPAPNSPHDLVAQFDLVDFGIAFGGVTLSDDRDVAAREARAVIEARAFYTRNLKGVVLPHLPRRTFADLHVELQPNQHRAYVAALDDLILDLTSVSDEQYLRDISTFMARRSALLRICSDPTPLVPGYDEVPAKIVALDSLLPDLVAAGEKVVVWSFYRHSLDHIARRYQRLGLVRIDGSVTDVDERRAAVRRFQQDDEVRVFLGNPAAAGAGLTLHAARYTVYESLSNQAAHYLQSLDRVHRRGQERDVEYVTLLCEGTIEEDEYRRLLEKADRQAELLGDPVGARPSRSVLLHELVASKERLER